MAAVAMDEIEERAKMALEKSSIYALHELNVAHRGDALIITGRVECYYHAQVAQEVVRHALPKKIHVVNEVEVEPSSHSDDSWVGQALRPVVTQGQEPPSQEPVSCDPRLPR